MTAARSIPATRQHLAVVLGLLLVCLIAPATAQEVPFRLVHQGNLLPEGTAVVVLEEAVDPSAGGRIQPRFIALDDYPRDASAVSFRDTLDARGRTAESYPRTQNARVLYFLYARTPDDAIYWSYSAQEDQLKFDVVQTGAMSVAPAPDEAAEVLRRQFFAPASPVAATPPVEADPAPDTAPDTAPAETPEADHTPSPSADAREAPTDVAPDTDAPPGEASDAVAEPAPPASDTTPASLTIALALLCAVLLAILLLLYRRYRALKDGVSDKDVMQAELAAAREQLQEYRHLEAEHKALQDKYETVRQHCDTLLEQHDRLRAQLQEARAASSEAPDQSPRA